MELDTENKEKNNDGRVGQMEQLFGFGTDLVVPILHCRPWMSG